MYAAAIEFRPQQTTRTMMLRYQQSRLDSDPPQQRRTPAPREHGAANCCSKQCRFCAPADVVCSNTAARRRA
jgi:hypothetical protein